jgi:hypothetical protein
MFQRRFRIAPAAPTAPLTSTLALASALALACVSLGCIAAATPGEPDAEPTDALNAGSLELGSALAGKSTLPAAVLTADDASAPTTSGTLALDPRPGSFLVVPQAGRMMVVGRDKAGAMYGAFELAERIRLDGLVAVVRGGAFAGAPALPIRGANLFLTVADPHEPSWWFRDLHFWRGYLDMLAHARINFLDLHGMYNPGNTLFPNALLYFARSPSFPLVGIPAADRDRNLDVLRTVVAMARARGIDVGLMTYLVDTSPIADGSGPKLSDADLRTYTREAAADLARRVPGLKRLGFRIGESGRDAAWFIDTIVTGVRSAGSGVEVYARTWGTTHDGVLAVAAQAPTPPVIEAKFNGEQLGAPYPIVGGVFTADYWTNYSYEGYLDDPTPPYRFVFQLRTGGTHRVFRQASYARAQRTVRSMLVGAVAGFSLEAPHSYSQVRDQYHKSDADKFSEWTFRRDELMYALYGRLGYDPTTPERVFRALLKRRVHTDALWDPLQAASDIVPWIQTANTCGPDHRDFAPELELGGSIDYWAQPAWSPAPPDACGRYVHNGRAYHGPFDSFAVASPSEAAADLVHGRATARMLPLEVARRVLADAEAARDAAAVHVDAHAVEGRDIIRECVALADLGDWFAHKLRGASALAVYGASGASDYLDAARAESRAAGQAWQTLADHTGYLLPWTEPLRMSFLGITPYHWSALVPRLAADDAGIDAVVADVSQHPRAPTATLPAASAWLDGARAAAPAVVDARVLPTASGWSATVTLDHAPAGTTVTLWYKPFSGLASWRAATLSVGVDGRFSGALDGGAAQGLQYAVEVAGSGFAARWPDIATATPYVAVAPASAN